MAQPQQPPQASRYRTASALVAARAAQQALEARPRGLPVVAGIVQAHQIAGAVVGNQSIGQMLAAQDIDVQADALLNAPGFTTEVDQMLAAFDKIANDFEFERLVESLVQDASRAAQSVAIAARPRIEWVRHLSPPSCSRCAVLAGRVYRYSQGFERHPGCDCVMLPVTVGSDLPYDVEDLVRTGQVTGLSKADRRAVADGADLGQVVNVRRNRGVLESGRVLYRRGRLTPEAIYRQTGDDRAAALALLQRNGYLR